MLLRWDMDCIEFDCKRSEAFMFCADLIAEIPEIIRLDTGA